MSDSPSLRDDQIADLAVLIAEPKTMLLHEQACGKTPIVCAWMFYLWSELKIGTVWAMPKSLLQKNYDELLRFSDFKPEDVVIVDGNKKEVEAVLKSGAKVFLMGFRRFTLSWRQLPDYVKAVCGDEIHMVGGWGHHNSKSSQALYEATKTRFTEGFVPMTGTLINGRLDTAYPSIHVIEPRYYPSYEAFMNYHGVFDWNENLIGWTNHEKLSIILGHHGIRRTFEQVHGKQAVVTLPEVVQMTPQQREMYDKFEREAILELEKFYVDGTLPGVATIRARQIMEHPNEFPDLTDRGKFVDIMPGERPGKEELIEVHFANRVRDGKPTILFSAMIPQMRRIKGLADQMGLKAVVMNSEVTQAKRLIARKAFESGEAQIMICSPAIAGVGLNWQFSGDQEVEHLIFASLDYMDTSFIQAYMRAIRGKRTKPLLITILEYANSLDQKLFSIIRRKSIDANKVDPTRPVIELSTYQEEDEKI